LKLVCGQPGISRSKIAHCPVIPVILLDVTRATMANTPLSPLEGEHLLEFRDSDDETAYDAPTVSENQKSILERLIRGDDREWVRQWYKAQLNAETKNAKGSEAIHGFTEQVGRFNKQNRAYFRGGRQEFTIIHTLFDSDYKDDAIEDFKPLLRLFLHLDPDLLDVKSRYDETPIHKAISEKFANAVQYLCQIAPDTSSAFICQGFKKNTCLHAAIKQKIRTVMSLLEKSDERTLMAKDDDSNTPLHVAVEYKRCEEKHIQLVEAIVTKCPAALNTFNKANMSPYRYHLESRLDEESKKLMKPPDSSQALAPGQQRKLVRVDSNSAQPRSTVPGRPPMPLPKVDAVKEKASPKKNQAKIWDKSAQEIELFLKAYCLRHMPHDDAKKILYGSIQGEWRAADQIPIE
jgi:hypothetical protein